MDLTKNARWYVIQTYSGHEDKVKTNLTNRVEKEHKEDFVFRIEVPEEIIVTEKNGENVEKKQKIYPGYVFVEMIMNDEVWYIVRNTTGVTGFVGSHGKGSKPVPMYDNEVKEIFKRAGLKMHESTYTVGDKVKIIGGAFAGTQGEVTEIDENTQKMVVSINLFGRDTSAEVDFDHVDLV
ncbi:MAG: transcription termination/antitermination protein NusG [Lactobacillales bacterium]|jgi:transcriptional antiterminator NusG|nr:transcription termination/antitermination protein NusG [Lactobacillales bacterium]